MLGKTNKEPLRVGGVNILPLDEYVRELGVVLDSNLTTKKHVHGSRWSSGNTLDSHANGWGSTPGAALPSLTQATILHWSVK